MIQLQVLNKLLDTKDKSIITANNLNEDFFSDYKNEYKFIKDHIDKYQTIPDKESFLSKFPTFDIIRVNENIPYLIDEIYEDKNKRTLANIFNQVRKLLTEDKTDEAMKLYSTAAQNLSKGINLTGVDITKDLSRYDRYVEKCDNIKLSYVSTGFPELDKIIGGWDRYEEYATIVARPGVGKSFCLIKSAEAAVSAGLKVGIYSGEMSVDKVAFRFDTMMGHISNRDLTHGNIESQVTYKKYIDSLAKENRGSLIVLTPDLAGGPVGVSTLKAFVEKYHLDMLCIDQHSLLEDDRRGKSAVDKAANISRDIKNLQVMTRIPVITVSQQNRESTEDGLSTKLVSQADRIGQDSTTVIFLEKKDGILTLSCVKARDSESDFKLQYAADYDKGIFTFIPNDNNPQTDQQCEDLRKEYEYEKIEGEETF